MNLRSSNYFSRAVSIINHSLRKYYFTLLLLLYSIFCILLIYDQSFLHNGKRYFTLFDDSMISMRYARNLASGHGLIWNPTGNAVEGFSNLLWTLYMSLWHLLPLHSSKVSLPIQLTGMTFLVVNLIKLKAIAEKLLSENMYAPIVVILTASYVPITYWAVRGMSHVILAFLLLCSLEECINLEQSGEFNPYRLTGLLGIGLLIRFDFFYLYILVTVFFLLIPSEKRELFGKLSFITFGVIMITQSLFRYTYYGDLLPNTYYLKISEIPWWIRLYKGFHTTQEFILLISPLFVLSISYGIVKSKSLTFRFLLYLIFVQLIYKILVGGDAWENSFGGLANRYISTIMPIFFLLLAGFIVGTIKSISQFFKNSIRVESVLTVLIVLLTIFWLHGGTNFANVIDKNSNKSSPDTETLSNNHRLEAKYRAKLGLQLRKITDPTATIAVTMAGNTPYFAKRFTIDQFGFTDRYIARSKPKIRSWDEYRPGHVKYDYDYSIITKKPDVITQLPGPPTPKLRSYLREHYTVKSVLQSNIFLQKNTPKIHWEKLTD